MSDFTPLSEILSKLRARQGIAEDITPEEKERLLTRQYNESEGSLNLQDGYDCPICKNRGDFIRIAETGEQMYCLCKCHKIRATLRRAYRSGLGNILKDFTFDKYQAADEWQKTIKERAQAFCKDDTAHWFYIGGQVGSGKTMICTAIAAHYIKAGQEVKYMIWSEEAKKLKSLANDMSYQDEIAIYKNVDVLYIDDFLKVKNGENPTPADINLAFEIINHRLLSKDKITIISSEKTLDELLEYDEATMSRIYQKTGDYKFNIGKDRRKNYRLREV